MPKNFNKYQPYSSKVNGYTLAPAPLAERVSRYRDGKEYRETIEMRHLYPMFNDGFDAKRTVDENDIEITEVYCSEFGCSKELSRQEKLFGNKCINHSISKRGIY